MAIELKSSFHFVTAFLSLVLILAGIATPGWLVLQSGDAYGSSRVCVAVGLWYVVVCSTDSGHMHNCITSSMHKLIETGVSSGTAHRHFGGMGLSYVELNVESVLAMICVLLASVLVVYRRLKKQSSKKMAIAVAIMLMLSACFTFILVGKMGRVNTVVSDLMTTTTDAVLCTPYSVIVAAIGGCFAMFDAIVMFIQIYKSEQSQQGIILSVGAAMDSFSPIVGRRTGHPSQYLVTPEPTSCVDGDHPLPPIQPHPSEFTDKNVLMDVES